MTPHATPPTAAPRRPRRARAAVLAGLGLALVASTTAAPAGAATDASSDAGTSLYLVTLDGPGTAGSGLPVPVELQAAALLAGQDAVLAAVGSPTPVYRFTTALDGFAVGLDAASAAALAARPGVALVEPSTVQRLARGPAAGVGAATRSARSVRPDDGAGVVVGVVDSGVDPDSPVLAPVAATTGSPRFRGTCDGGADLGPCTTKIVGAAWFAAGFGPERVRSADPLSARDADGHGTLVASIAAGARGLPVRVGASRLGTFSGAAPAAQVAAYKACWTAPDPADDGCASADVVAAIDRAAADGVDVLTLAVVGSSETVERALLGATEAGALVVAAAGNDPDRPAAHASPWVLTVGAATGPARRARVRLSGGGPVLDGASSSTRTLPALRLVQGSEAALGAGAAARRAARTCAPGSLDAARVQGRAVLCLRGGGVPRVAKSQAVAQAGGRAVLLVNRAGRSTAADLHAVPTVHLDAREGRSLRRWATRHPRGEVTLGRSRLVERDPAPAPWSSTGAPGLVKPDLLAPGSGVLGASTEGRWDLLSGTSASAAQVSGAAATLMARSGLDAATVRSVLTTSATDAGPGPGALAVGDDARPGVVVTTAPGDYRRLLEDPAADLDLPTVDLATTATRTLTNPGRRTRVLTATTEGFTSRVVLVAPAVLRLGPGESATVVLEAGGSGPDAGSLVWTGDDGTVARMPVRLR